MAYNGAAALLHGCSASAFDISPVPTAQPEMAYDRPEIWRLATATGCEPWARAKL